MRMPSRKFHSKTRHGCDTCKRGKVRCDLQRPICKRCTRLARPCSFADETDQSSLIVIPSRYGMDSGKHGSGHDTPNLSTTRDLELMHFYSTSTCLTMTDDKEVLPIWQHTFPKLAFKHPFLLHGILALTALHQRQDSEQEQCEALNDYAAAHQSAALAGYIPLLQTIDQDDCHALFALSQLLPALSFAFLQYPKTKPSAVEFVDSFIRTFDLLIGATVIAVEGKDWLRAGPLAPIMKHPFTNASRELPNITGLASSSIFTQQSSFGRSPQPTAFDLDFGDADINDSPYASGVQLLSSLLSQDQDQSTRIARLIAWPVFAGASYLALLKNHDAKSLVILAHYGAALHLNKDIWYLQDLGGRLVKAVFELVDPQWRSYLRWPLSRIVE